MKSNNTTYRNIAVWDFIIYIILIIFLTSSILPIKPDMPSSGLDSSWRYAMDYAFLNNLQFGKDICFTFGPLSDFWFPIYFYADTTYKFAIMLSILLDGVIFFSLVFICRNISLVAKIIGLFSIVIGLNIGMIFLWYVLPILFVQIVFLENINKKIQFVLSILLIFFLSFSILIKFSHFPLAILSVLSIDIYFYFKYKNIIPLYTITLFIFIILLFMMSGQSIVNFPAYFTGSFNILSGYSEAMQIFGPNKTIYIFLVLSILMLLALIKPIVKSREIKTYIFVLISALVLFMSFKNGFVRHDMHAVEAYSGLCFTFGLLLIYFYKSLSFYKNNLYLAYILCLIAVFMSYIVKTYYADNNIGYKNFVQILNKDIVKVKDNFLSIPDILKHTTIKRLNLEYNFSIKKIKRQMDLSEIKGTVDIYPWDQSYIIANGLEYRPRPIIQSYSVYTPYLIEKNIEFLKSNKAPENILFSIKTIDGRAPFMMEGASWLEIMKKYDVIDIKKEFLVLKKTNQSKVYNLKLLSEKTIKFGDKILVPTNKQIYVTIKIQKSFFGKILNILFKPPVLWIELTLNNKHKENYRIVPGIASSGFILSPFIKSIKDFFAFSVGNLSTNEVQSIRLINKFGYGYKNAIDIKYYTITTNNFKISNTISKNIQKINFYYSLIKLNRDLKPPFFQLETINNENILFSHIGISFDVSGKMLNEIAINNKINIGYSIKKDAYTNGNTSEGGCFNIYENRKLIKHNCINPKANILDRDEKNFTIENIDKNKNYTFEVLPIKGKSSAFGWSYWKF